MRKLTPTQLKIAAWAGIIGPVLFVAVFTVEGFLRPDYDMLSAYVSALSLGPRGWIQIVNFMVFGLLLYGFAQGVGSEIRSGKASRGGVRLLTIIAGCYFFSGPFVMDPDGTPLTMATVHGAIHGILGAAAFLLMPISCFVYLRRFNEDANWYEMRGWTLILGTVAAAALVILTIVTKVPNYQSLFADWVGLIQRELIIPFMVWVFIFGLALLKKTKTGS